MLVGILSKILLLMSLSTLKIECFLWRETTNAPNVEFDKVDEKKIFRVKELNTKDTDFVSKKKISKDLFNTSKDSSLKSISDWGILRQRSFDFPRLLKQQPVKTKKFKKYSKKWWKNKMKRKMERLKRQNKLKNFTYAQFLVWMKSKRRHS